MSQSSSPRRWRPPKIVRIVRARPRLFLCVLLGLAVLVLLLPADWRVTTRLLVAWDAGVFVYLIAAVQLMMGADPARMRRRAALLDEGALAILVLVVVAALASLGAIVAQLGASAGTAERPWHLALAFVTILLAWALIHAIFALHYAHEFYAEGPNGGGLTFPGNEAPDYWDFVYFSLVVGMTSQVSDVAVTSRHIRRTVSAHGVVSFLFNAALIALTVNIAASALAG